MNIPYAPALLQLITGGTAGAVIMWYLGARKHSLERSLNLSSTLNGLLKTQKNRNAKVRPKRYATKLF